MRTQRFLVVLLGLGVVMGLASQLRHRYLRRSNILCYLQLK